MKGCLVEIIKGINKGAAGVVVHEDKHSVMIRAPDWPLAWFDHLYELKVNVKVKGEK